MLPLFLAWFDAGDGAGGERGPERNQEVRNNGEGDSESDDDGQGHGDRVDAVGSDLVDVFLDPWQGARRAREAARRWDERHRAAQAAPPAQLVAVAGEPVAEEAVGGEEAVAREIDGIAPRATTVAKAAVMALTEAIGACALVVRHTRWRRRRRRLGRAAALAAGAHFGPAETMAAAGAAGWVAFRPTFGALGAYVMVKSCHSI